jgi:hypothetical protein
MVKQLHLTLGFDLETFLAVESSLCKAASRIYLRARFAILRFSRKNRLRSRIRWRNFAKCFSRLFRPLLDLEKFLGLFTLLGLQ